MLLIIILYALFASSFSFGKILLEYSTPIFLPGIRMFLGGLALLAYQYFYANEEFRFKKKHWWLYAQIVFFGVYLNYILRFWALDYLTSSKTCFLYNFSPFFSALYSYFIFRESMSKRQWVGLIVGFVGLIPILLSSTTTEKTVGEFFFLSLPELAVLVSVALHSYSWIVMRKLVRDKSYSPTLVNGVTMFAGGFLALVTSFIFETGPRVTNILPFAGWLLIVILISNVICYNLYGNLLRKYSPTFLSFAGFLSPIFAGFYGWVFLSEHITWHFYISGVIVFMGLYLFYQEELKKYVDPEEHEKLLD